MLAVEFEEAGRAGAVVMDRDLDRRIGGMLVSLLSKFEGGWEVFTQSAAPKLWTKLRVAEAVEELFVNFTT